MEFMRLEPAQREALLDSLQRMPTWLEESFAALSPDEARTGGADGAFAPVEQVWHLADLEREGFGVRLTRLQAEQDPLLADFDGTAIAAARSYRSLSLQEGLESFRRAREHNLALLRAVPAEAWTRGGTQERVGRVTLCDMPEFMRQHDAAHHGEIEAWKKARL